MARIRMDIPKTLSNLENNLEKMNDHSVPVKDWIFELVLQVSILRNVCAQQQEEIEALKKFDFRP